MLASGWWLSEAHPVPQERGATAAAALRVVQLPPVSAAPLPPERILLTEVHVRQRAALRAPGPATAILSATADATGSLAAEAPPRTFSAPSLEPGFGLSIPALARPAEQASRWSGSAWLFIREGSGGNLVPGGMLGGSQAGARLTYRINQDAARPTALSARAYMPLDDPDSAEAAIGLDWQPVRSLPIHVLAERREALCKEGRSGFSATVYGGVSDERAGPFRLDAYAQAGVVGARSRDFFADGSAKLSVASGRMRAGVGAWGAAQPGVERLDIGPQASVAVPIAGTSVVIAADWRFRVAGEAAPDGGPTLTISTGF